MKIKRAFAVLLVWCFFPLFSVADDPVVVDPCHYSTEGTDFWFGLMQNRSVHPDHYLEITVTSR